MDGGYALSCSLYGHVKDVRDLAPLYQPNGAFISVSRDMTSRIWAPLEYETGYREGLVMSGHENFVSCVCVLPPDAEHPQGLILTGSNDHCILGFTVDSPAPVFKLTGHSNTVCALAAGKFGTFVSGSWDCTAKLWVKQELIMTLKGHEAAVWCVAILPRDEKIITGSADKTLKLWNSGKEETVFRGHEDCVRCIVITDPNHFLTSSNDTTIRFWELSGSCLRVFTGHSSYVYALACLGPSMEFASCSEDQTVKIWKGGECSQTIPHPSQSVWCICALPNGDIATGSSDGVVRIFTQDSSRVADPQQLADYEEYVSKSSIPAQIGDIKTEDLLGPDALHIPGKKEGQTLMIKRKNVVEAYQWSQVKKEWQKIGDVVGGESSGAAGEGVLFEGQRYDFVFDVSVSEGYPMLKLPYNSREDPYMAAHKFLERNELSPLFLDQVAAFIQQQSGSITLGENQTSYVDPYTGSSRYVSSNVSTDKKYSEITKKDISNRVSFFPEKELIKFGQINICGLIGKLNEFNREVDETLSVSNSELMCIQSLLEGKNKDPREAAQVIWKLLNWTPEMMFPALDVLRYALLDPNFNDVVFSLEEPAEFVHLSCRVIDQSNSSRNQFLIIRALCNALHHNAGRKSIMKNAASLLEKLGNLKYSADKNLQIALASLFLNLSVASLQLANNDSLKSSLLLHLSEIITFVRDEEAYFRHVVTIGTITFNDELSVAVAKSLGLHEVLKSHSCLFHTTLEKIKKSSESLLSQLS